MYTYTNTDSWWLRRSHSFTLSLSVELGVRAHQKCFITCEGCSEGNRSFHVRFIWVDWSLDSWRALNGPESMSPSTFSAVFVCSLLTCPVCYSQWNSAIRIDRLVPLEHRKGAAVGTVGLSQHAHVCVCVCVCVRAVSWQTFGFCLFASNHTRDPWLTFLIS